MTPQAVTLVRARPLSHRTGQQLFIQASSGARRPISTISSVPSFPYQLARGITFTVDAFQGAIGIGGASIPQWGDIAIGLGQETRKDAGAHPDDVTDCYFDGRPCEVWRGTEAANGTPENLVEIFNGQVVDAIWDPGLLTLIHRDFAEALQVNAQASRYGGGGGVDGGAELANRPKPLGYGVTRFVPPIFLDNPELYQLHDGALEMIQPYDGGIPFRRANGGANDITQMSLGSLAAWTAVGGDYITELAAGRFRLGNAPFLGLTAEFRNPIQHGGAIIQDLIARQSALAAAVLLDSTSFTEFSDRTGCPPLALYLTDDTPINAICDAIMQTLGGLWTFTPSGRLRVRQVIFDNPVAHILPDQVQSITRVRTPLPPNGYALNGGRNYAPLARDRIGALGVPFNPSTLLAPWAFTYRFQRLPPDSGLAIKDLVIDTLFSWIAGLEAQTEMLRQLHLLTNNTAETQSPRLNLRDRYEVVVKGHQFALAVGDTVTLSFPRFGLDDGREFLALGITEDTASVVTMLRLWG